MAETSAAVDKLQDTFSSLFEKIGAGKNQGRTDSFTYLQENGLPHHKDEEYKYTPLTRLVEKQLDLPALLGKTAPSSIDPASFFIPEVVGDRVVFINGEYSPEHSELSNNLEVSFLRDSGDLTELVQAHYGTHSLIKEDGWAAMNTALSQEGLVIRVKTDRKEGTPLYIYHLTDASQSAGISQPHHLILAERSATFQVVEVFGSEGDNPALVNSATEIILRENARVEHYKVGLEGQSILHAGHTMVYQARDSHYHNVTLSLSGGVTRNNLNITLDAENCESHMIGLYLPYDKQHIDNHTVVDHRKPNSFSNELYKGVMADKSTAIFNGKIFVRQDAQKTNAFQSNKNLLLSNDATINTKPQLEIWADDVKCSHGATTGQLDEEQVFYLMSRGLSREHARAMLLGAFASEVTEQIHIEPVKAYIEKIVSDRLTY